MIRARQNIRQTEYLPGLTLTEETIKQVDAGVEERNRGRLVRFESVKGKVVEPVLLKLDEEKSLRL